MSKRPLSSVTRRFFLKAGSVGGALGALATTGLAAFVEACSGGSSGVGGGCSYGYGYGYGGGYGYGYGCVAPTTKPYGTGGYGYGGYGTGGYGYGGYGYGHGAYGGAMNDAAPTDEQDTALRLGLAPGRVGPAQRIRV